MKKHVIFLLTILFFALKSYSQKPNIGAHIGAGFALGGAANFIPQFKVSERPGKAIWIGGVTGFMAGLSKEFHDEVSGSQKDLGDLINTTFGGFLGGIAACEIQKIINKKRQKKNKIVVL